MDYALSSKSIYWQLLILFSVSLVLQKISAFFRQRTKLTLGLSSSMYVLATVAVVFGVYNSYLGWQSQAKAAGLIASANHHAIVTRNNPEALAPHAAPSTVQPSENNVESYQVAPNMSRYLIIPKLGVQARVLSVGLDKDGSIGTPDNVFDTAWYDQSVPPGQSGATLIDGHISSWTSPGVFYHLNELNPGDIIEVQMGSGLRFTYTVVKAVVYDSSNVDMSQVLQPVTPGQSGLNLMSCFGSVVSDTNEFNKRIVVYASINQES